MDNNPLAEAGLSSTEDILLELASDIIWSRDFRTGKGTWLLLPKQFDQYNLPGQGLSTEEWKQVLHEGDRQEAFNRFIEASNNKTVNTFHQAYRLKINNETFFIREKIKFERDAYGIALRCTGVWSDFTDLYEREQLLRITYDKLPWEIETLERENEKLLERVAALTQSEFMFNKAQAISRIGSWQIDLRTGSFSCSDEFYEIHGIDKRFQFNDMSFFGILYGIENGMMVLVGLNKLKSEGKPLDMTFRYATEMGAFRWLRLMAYPFYHKERMSQITGVVHDITAFKQNEERLRASEEKFITLFKFTPDFMSLARESDGVIVNVNDKALMMSGFTEEEVVGKTVAQLNLWLNPQDLKNYFQEYEEKGRVTTETHWKKKNGELLYIMLTSVRVRISDENYRLSLIKDITSRKKAEEKFNVAFNLNPNLMILMRDADSIIVDVNERIEETFGYTREETIGNDALILGLWADVEERKKQYEIYRKNKKVSYETKLRKKGGQEIDALVSAVEIHLSDGTYILTSVKDVTERVQAEKKFKTVFRSSPDMMAIIRQRDGVIMDINDQVFKAIGYRREELIGKSTSEIDIWFKSEQRVQADLSRQPVVPYEARLKSKEGKEVFVLVSASLIEISGEPHVLYITKDNSDRKQAEDKLRYSEANLTAIINNTQMLIWSLDANYNILVANDASKAFAEKYYGSALSIGQSIKDFDSFLGAEMVQMRDALYQRVLHGEHINFSYEQFGRHFDASINPIKHNEKIVGLTIFSMDVTDRIAREREVVTNLEQLAEAEKHIGELRLVSLRSAMNPHFIFNALNSIQFFISNNERHRAIQYLSTFSKLIRGILVGSAQSKIMLSEEIDLLKHYIDLEQLRYENKFMTYINLHPDIDLSMEVPSLLIQPFVENAILHGLSNLKQDGVLKISVLPHDEDHIMIEIDDNGIGREAAKKLQRISQKRHKSMGISLAEERLKAINKHSQLAIETEDLYSDDKPAGTRVKIWLQKR